jgi:hypothetical protein
MFCFSLQLLVVPKPGGDGSAFGLSSSLAGKMNKYQFSKTLSLLEQRCWKPDGLSGAASCHHVSDRPAIIIQILFRRNAEIKLVSVHGNQRAASKHQTGQKGKLAGGLLPATLHRSPEVAVADSPYRKGRSSRIFTSALWLGLSPDAPRFSFFHQHERLSENSHLSWVQRSAVDMAQSARRYPANFSEN